MLPGSATTATSSPARSHRRRSASARGSYVPDPHVVPFADLSPAARDDIRDYVATLAARSAFFAAALAAEPPERTAAAR